ncbi:MAG: hypothetical protein GX874_12780 [Smithella sp.]|jgi:hypothetical protein|nr:hypothetical protein [Smithellaceae bacterium]NLA42248.1 hypothetical protein [Smithella sp.]
MIPENRICNGSFSIPKLWIGKEDIVIFAKEFKGFHAQFADCFSREERVRASIGTWRVR